MAVMEDANWMAWALKAAGALIMFLMALGLKDIRDRIKRAEELCGLLQVLEERISGLEDRISRMEGRSGHDRY